MIETMQTTMNSNFDEMRKQIDDQKFDIKKIETEITELKKKSENNGPSHNNSMGMTGDLGGEGAGNGKISKAQQAFNSMVEERISQLTLEVERLQRIDLRINKELVKKPYQYIDKVREALDKEQKEIVSIINKNNEKYVSKIT